MRAPQSVTADNANLMINANHIDIVVEDPRWLDTLPEHEELAHQAVSAAFRVAEYTESTSFSVLLADDGRIAVLNRDFRGLDKPTNVLSFPAVETPEIQGKTPNLGDIALAFDSLFREASEADRTFRNHFLHLIVHASLHLIGCTHDLDEEAERMEAREIRALAELGVANPYEETGDRHTAYGTREP